MGECENDGARHFGYELRRLSHLFRRNLDRFAAQALPGECTGVQVWMLGFIARGSEHGDVFQRDLEKNFNVRGATATGTLKLMEKNGLLTRESVPYDARLKKIVLTPQGKSAAAGMKAAIDRLEQEIDEAVGAEDLAAFYRVVDRVRGMME